MRVISTLETKVTKPESTGEQFVKVLSCPHTCEMQKKIKYMLQKHLVHIYFILHVRTV